MKCSNCGGELILNNGIGICSSCNSEHRIEGVFEKNDVCICCIGTDKNGRRSKDSIISAEIYKKLQSKKIKCFYEYISAEDFVGDDLEAIKYAAANNAEIILFVGTSTESFSALLDKYSDIVDSKKLIPVVSEIKPEQLPEKLKCFQAASFDSLGAMDDLSISLLNILGRENEVQLEEIYNKNQKKKKAITITIASIVAILICIAGIVASILYAKSKPVPLTNDEIYANALLMLEEKKFLEAATEFSKIADFKDSTNQFKKIYNRYDGYYLDEASNGSLYINIVDGKTADVIFEKTSDNKLLKIEESLVMENNTISGRYIDTLSNEGAISITLGNENIDLAITTDISSDKATLGDITIQFNINNKTDRPSIRGVNKELLMSWMKTLTYVDDVKAAGYELEYIGDDDPYNFSFGTQYTIKNIDITIITTKDDLSKYTGPTAEELPKHPKDVIVAVIAPINLIYPEKINKSACIFVEDGIIYNPNSTDISEFHSSSAQGFYNFVVEGKSSVSNETEGRTINALAISEDSTVGMTSKALIGEHNYNLMLSENKRIYYQTIAFNKYNADNPESNDHKTLQIVAESDDAYLICVHQRELINGLDYGTGGTYTYLRVDINSEECEMLAIHNQSSYVNAYGSREYSYDTWKNDSSVFGEFINSAYNTTTKSADSLETMYVSVDEGLNLREQPNTSSNIITVMRAGQSVEVLEYGSTGEWVKVQCGSLTGYCVVEYLSSSAPVFASGTTSTIKVTDSLHRIYSGPSYDSRLIQTLPNGTYTIVEKQTDENGKQWGKLKSGIGWICLTDM